MSRIGKKPILLPPGIEVVIEENTVVVKNAKTHLLIPLPPHAHVRLTSDPSALEVTVDDENEVYQRALWGLARQLIQNAVDGLQKPFEKTLEFVGVGFKVNVEGKNLIMDVGFSHKVTFSVPEGVEVKVEKQTVTLTSADKYLLGEIAARIRRIKPPEPYKGKGIKYVNEVIRRKAGKTAKTAG